MRRWHLIALTLALGTTASAFFHYNHYGTVSLLYCAIALFLWMNFVICLWEMCLAARIDYIHSWYAKHMPEYRGRELALVSKVLNEKLTVRDVFSPTSWADIWIGYAAVDPSYADRKSFGFFIDFGNGYSTIIPTVLLIMGLAVPVLPARVLGIIGIVIFYQIAYGTVIYYLSFVFNKRYRGLGWRENLGIVALSNAFWIVFPALGIYASVHMILENSFDILLT